ncbi:hypothetical protein U876_07040 [Aeromonas hydrophila NJ-35]|nr:hypothetical protein V469_07060 [Aeromonas hydrophila J-1]AKJ37003.1 hypothetical protein U876_07040 [Aeromonas hydrophila NJ-35]ANR99384.1 hypothetical protein A9258_07025 [Aeromonas hydrophila]CAD7546122.1 hypothetical protein KBAHV27_31210 [Aeromonas hydrophila]CAD7546227.1 hypothetical protein KBAHV46_31250 [Aeromonas hydrophila]
MQQVTIHLISGDLLEAEGGIAHLVQPIPVSTSRVEQHIGADDISLDKIGMPGNGAVKHDSRQPDASQHRVDAASKSARLQISTCLKAITITCLYTGQQSQITGIGELVEVDNGILGIMDDMAYNGGADKTCTTGNKNFHYFNLRKWLKLRCKAEILKGEPALQGPENVGFIMPMGKDACKKICLLSQRTTGD